ncbi:MAG: SMP-30/gluconolactonase/LRE family protein [Steroidobacter sp.]
MNSEAECVWPVGAQLGEGPMWSAREQALWFVDIKGRRIHRLDEASGEQHTWQAPEDVGFIVPSADGAFVCGLKSGLHRFDPGAPSFTLIERVEAERPHNRSNDACVDRAGRLWFGTMDNREAQATGALYRYDAQGLRCVDDGYIITNGPAVSPDGRTLYPVDTTQRVICAADLNDDGSLSNGRVFARIDIPGAYPDGPTVDAEGCLWVALFGGWGVQRYSPQGALLETLQLPVANCTKAAFGGAELRDLYVTTAWNGLAPAQRAQQPLAGGLFRIRTDVTGLASPEMH